MSRASGLGAPVLVMLLLVLDTPALANAQAAADPAAPAAPRRAARARGSRLPPGVGPLITSGVHTATRTPQLQPVRAPPGTKILTMTPGVKQLPAMTGLSMSDLNGLYSGPAAPRVSGPSKRNMPQILANGVLGGSFSDSRLSSEYVSLGQTRNGRLLGRFNGTVFGCTASIINRALLVTAAHCVCLWGLGSECFPDVEAGQLQMYFERDDGSGTNFVAYPVVDIVLPSVYAYGTDTNVDGVITNNDLAIVWVAPNGTQQVGGENNWNAYGTNGYGFASQLSFDLGPPAAPASAMVSAIAYSAGQDNFTLLQISHSPAYNILVGSQGRGKPPRPGMPRQSPLKNMIRSSSLQGGSSGSPWTVNYGVVPVVEDPATLGRQAERNVVIGVTSWGYRPIDGDIAGLQGASFFGNTKEFPENYPRGNGNIGALMSFACDDPDGWNLAAQDVNLCV